MFTKLRSVAERRNAPWWIVGVALLLVFPSLTSGRGMDDYVHALILSGSDAFGAFERGRLDLFRFASPETNAAAMEEGIFPWWANQSLRFAFFRPLSALTHALDYALWPDNPLLMHAHGLLWYGATLVGVWVLFRDVMGARWVATLALALYALDDTRGAPVAWIANRNALVALAFSVWSIIWYHRARAGGRRIGRWLSPATFAVGLLAGDGAISILAYLGAYALVLDTGPLAQRLGRLGPHAAILALWAMLSKTLGYGVSGSGLYFDPVGDAGLFVTHLPERFLVLLFAQLGGPWSEGWNAYGLTFPAAATLVVVGGVATIGLTGLVITPVLRRSPTARFWALGGLGAIVPSCAAFPADRLLPWVSIGIMGALAELMRDLIERRDELWPLGARRRLAATVAWAMVTLHLVAAPMLLPLRARGIAEVNATFARAFDTVPRDPEITTETVVYVNPPTDAMVAFLPMTREVLGIPHPLAQRWLTTGVSPLTITRVDDHTLRVSQERGFLSASGEKLLRGPTPPFRVGSHVELSDMAAEIVAVTEDHRPAEVVFRFAAPLESPRFRWLAWEGVGYVPFTPPAVGQTVTLPAVSMLRILLGPDHPVVGWVEGAS